MKKTSIARKATRVGAWAGIVVMFVAGLTVSARIGTDAALARLPDSVRRSRDSGYPLGVEVVVGRDGEPVFLSRSVQALRNFFFTHPEAAARRAAETEFTELRRFVGEIRVRTVHQDADLVNVEVQSGALNGDSYWIHRSQLPELIEPPKKASPSQGDTRDK